MANTNFGSVEEYLATKPDATRAVLEQVRAALQKALPNATETISYQIPAYKQHGGTVIFFAGWKEHFSLYPASAALVAAFEKELAPYKVSKGTIRFPLSEPVPARLIGRLAKFRAQETKRLAEEKAAARRTGKQD